MNNKRIWTIGHGKDTKEKFIDILNYYHISVLIDIRSIPGSKYNPQFNKRHLDGQIGRVYKWFPQLGGKPLYPKNEIEKRLIKIIKVYEYANICLMCSEKNPNKCHRKSNIEPILFNIGCETIHILEIGEVIQNENASLNDYL